ncbi:hypothetical protein [Streptomyces sp. NPDC058622]|uniref:hypothetical protein n=1 Tax=Streptomyces sp. NPDC058622 TaxID=3346562 RepID=UPI0036625A7B
MGEGSQGWAACAPYDRVLITASLREIPADIIQQTDPAAGSSSPRTPRSTAGRPWSA